MDIYGVLTPPHLQLKYTKFRNMLTINFRDHMNTIRFSYIAVFLILCACVQNTKDSDSESSLDADYPDSAEQLTFELYGGDLDSMKIVAEIDIWDNGTPVGQINGMEKFGDTLFFSDAQQKCVHVIGADLNYIRSIGTGMSGPEPIYNLFGISRYNDILVIGDGSGPNLFKTYEPLTGQQQNYKNNNPSDWPFYGGGSGFFLADSIAYITKMIADNGNKVARYKVSDGAADKLDDIVAINSLHAETDSATASRIIARMSLLRSNTMDRRFYVLPADKYLINQYDFEGKLIRSIDLRSIPEIADAVDFWQQVPTSNVYQSAVIDEEDNIYFHIPAITVSKAVYEPEDVGMYLISLNLSDSSYRLYPMVSRSVKPLRIIDNTLWCYDFTESRLLEYKF